MVFSTFTFKGLLGQLSESSLSKHLTCVFRTYSQLQPINFTYFSLLISRQVVGVLILSKHLTCVSRTHSQPQPVEIFSMLISRQVVGVFTVQTPHLCLQDSLPTSACRDTHKHFKNMSSPAINWQVTFNKWPHSQHAKKMKWNKTHVTWIKNTQALRCPWLYISNVPTQWSLQNLSTSSTQISRKPRSSVQTISASP